MVGVAVVRRHIRVCGLVQGVGFRPFVHGLATDAGLAGLVGNDVAGVFIEVEGPADVVDRFVADLAASPPPLARVDDVVSTDEEPRHPRGVSGASFTIAPSRSSSLPPATYVAPDAAVCDDCLAELFDPTDVRYRYPFITCTNCGPRFTITTALPYDRPNTTMAEFPLCAACATQYGDPTDRRFHAQPLACSACGPRVWLETDGDATAAGDEAIAAAQQLLAAGAIVAIKGLGGYHLACDATSVDAVARLRDRKHRADKPFAVMAPSLAAARTMADIGDTEAVLLASPARPVVLLRALHATVIAPNVAPGNPMLGVVLPYVPLQHLLFAPVPGRNAPVPTALVMTSGNLTDEPICFENDEARARLRAIADAFLVHDRLIHVPCDDSVVRVVDGCVLPIRRSRGYAPMPVRLPVAAPPMLGVGGELKNTFCMARGRDAWLSQHIGDMGSIETLAAFELSTRQLRALYAVAPALVAADMHPGYQTSAWAERCGLGPVHAVQHHHAHLAALLAEHGEPLDAQVIGVVFDGTGYGTDSTIWGGEVLVGGYANVTRAAHLKAVQLPGGDATIARPYRAALAHLCSAGIAWDADLPCVAAASGEELDVLARQLERRFHCVPSSSMGRLFDSVASVIGVRHAVSYEAQAALELEQLAIDGAGAARAYAFALDGGVLDPAPVLAALVEDVRAGVAVAAMAAGFHLAVASATADLVVAIAARTGITTVGLTGGVFQNAVLTTTIRAALMVAGLRVLTHSLVPPNDGGLALGQVAVVAARLAHTEHD